MHVMQENAVIMYYENVEEMENQIRSLMKDGYNYFNRFNQKQPQRIANDCRVSVLSTPVNQPGWIVAIYR